jgi:DNA-directed RNA polymerase subunit RPC12/RpoP
MRPASNEDLMSEFKFFCPKCQQHLQCDEQFSGREIQCPACNVLLRIPPVPGQTAKYNPESGKTWATFVPSGKAQPPKDLKLQRKPTPPEPSGAS